MNVFEISRLREQTEKKYCRLRKQTEKKYCGGRDSNPHAEALAPKARVSTNFTTSAKKWVDKLLSWSSAQGKGL